MRKWMALTGLLLLGIHAELTASPQDWPGDCHVRDDLDRLAYLVDELRCEVRHTFRNSSLYPQLKGSCRDLEGAVCNLRKVQRSRRDPCEWRDALHLVQRNIWQVESLSHQARVRVIHGLEKLPICTSRVEQLVYGLTSQITRLKRNAFSTIGRGPTWQASLPNSCSETHGAIFQFDPSRNWSVESTYGQNQGGGSFEQATRVRSAGNWYRPEIQTGWYYSPAVRR